MRTVFFDIDTQIDFVFPAGALYVPGSERLVPAFAKLNRYAASNGIPVVSTMDAHAENDPEFRDWPPHCIAGTISQQKPAATLLEKRTVVPIAPGSYELSGAQQIILEKQKLDLFSNPNLPAVLEQLNAERYVVYGVVTEYCVKCAMMGLLRLGSKVAVLADAIQAIDPIAGEDVLREFRNAGGDVVSIDSVCRP